jgi:predicted lipoprotein with Yx(FWY)xxD motif
MKKNFSLIGVLCTIVIITLSLGGCKTAKTSQTTNTTTTLTTLATSNTTTTQSVAALTVNVNTKTGIGTYLVDGNGRTLYWTTLDSVGQSNVTGAILANWPVFYNSNIVVPSSLNASDFGSIVRADGTKQTTYKGRPIYYYINDQTAGNTFGQGINGIWFAADPALSGPTLVTTAPTTTTTSLTSTTTTTAATTTTPPTSTTYTTTTTSPSSTTSTTTTSYPGY